MQMRVETKKRGARKRAGRQGERTRGFAERETDSFLVLGGRREKLEINEVEVEVRGKGDDLNRLTINCTESGSQRLVSFYYLLKTSPQCFHIYRRGYPQRRSDIINRTVWIKL